MFPSFGSSLYPKKYLLAFLGLGVRPDGRLPDAARPLRLNVGSISSADGSALLRCGDTTVVCGVKLELVSSVDSQKGFVVCNVEYGSSCLPESLPGAPPSEVQALSQQLQVLLNEYVNLELLTVENSELVWVVNVDVLCLSHHGNLLDACSLAAVAALKNTHLPAICTDSGVPRVKFTTAKSLPLRAPLFTVSFALINKFSLLDPSLEEEKAAQGHLSVSLETDGTIKWLEHTGLKVCEQQILRLSQLAMKRVALLDALLQTSQQ